MKFERESGILLHPTSLPGKYGIGDLGDEAYQLIDFLHLAKQSLWQVLPLGQTGYGDSPYQCFSAFAGNTLLISPEKLVEDGFLSVTDLQNTPDFLVDKVDFSGVLAYKNSTAEKSVCEFSSYRRSEYCRFISRFLRR